MIWVFVFGGIALAGLVMLVAYAVWLVHKTADLLSEVSVLNDRTGQFLALLGEIQLPEPAYDTPGTHRDRTVVATAPNDFAT